MVPSSVLLIGGSGFVGGELAARLVARGWCVTIPTRRSARAARLLLLPTVSVIEADVSDPSTLVSLMRGVDAVINLVGLLNDPDPARPYGRNFAAAHVELPQKIVAAMGVAGVRRLLHVSALQAAPEAPSAYLRSKAAGEAVVCAAAGSLDTTIFRPSVIFGPGDSFLNRFADLLRLFPVFPLAGAHTRFQPVAVADVAEAFVDALARRETFGQTYELGGPEVYTLHELVALTARQIGRRPCIVDLPAPLARLQAALLSLLPNPPLSVDNLRSLEVDSLADAARSYPGWQPRALSVEAPFTLSFVNLMRLAGYRRRAGR